MKKVANVALYIVAAISVLFLILAIYDMEVTAIVFFGLLLYGCFKGWKKVNNPPTPVRETSKSKVVQNIDDDFEGWGSEDDEDEDEDYMDDLPPDKYRKAHIAGEPSDFSGKTYIRRLFVAGVSFDNPDGTSRQEYLKKIHGCESPFAKKLTVDFKEFEYKGKPAFYIMVNDCCVGVVPADQVDMIKSTRDRIVGIDECRISPSYEDKANNDVVPYRLRFKLKIKSK